MFALRLTSVLNAAALALAMALPGNGATPVTTRFFSLAFPDGWTLAPPGPNELPAVVLDTALDVSCLFDVVVFSHPIAFSDLKVPASTFSHGDSVAKVEDGTLTLGGRKFLYAEYHGPDSGGTTKRVRAYYDLYDSTHLFCAFVDYIAPQGGPDVAVMETALAAVSYTGTTTFLRGLPARARALPAGKQRDVLGRPRAQAGPTPRLLSWPHGQAYPPRLRPPLSFARLFPARQNHPSLVRHGHRIRRDRVRPRRGPGR
jgi:hypothetical protein